jgi:hypothetical protein
VFFFFQVLFCFVSFNFGNFISMFQLRSQNNNKQHGRL